MGLLEEIAAGIAVFVGIAAVSSMNVEDVKNALGEMLLSGGSLNLKLLGAEQWTGDCGGQR